MFYEWLMSVMIWIPDEWYCQNLDHSLNKMTGDLQYNVKLAHKSLALPTGSTLCESFVKKQIKGGTKGLIMNLLECERFRYDSSEERVHLIIRSGNYISECYT
jgi:hypothetical protein